MKFAYLKKADMEEKVYFPKVIVLDQGTGHEALLGFRLKSILKGNLFFNVIASSGKDDSQIEDQHQKKLQQSREGFLSAVASWSDTVTLEMVMTSAPNLANRAQGYVSICLLLRVIGKTEQDAREDIISKYMSMASLLSAFMSEAEFSPIVDEKELECSLYQFKPRHAMAIYRRQEDIFLSAPFKRRVVGLLSGENHQVAEGYMVRYRYPWVTSHDDWSRLLSMLMNALDPLKIVVRLRSSRICEQQRRQLEDTIRSCELYLKTGESTQLTLQLQADMIRNATLKHLIELTEHAFNLGVFILAEHPIDRSLGGVLGHAITARQLADNNHEIFQGGFGLCDVNADDAVNGNYFYEQESFSLKEAASAFRLPSPPLCDQPGLPLRGSRTTLSRLPDVNDRESKYLELFINEHNNVSQPVKLPNNDRMRHTFIIGQTGTGKSTLMESMILQDIGAGEGLAVIDPHGDMIDSILGKIPENRVSDVILFDVLDREKPIGFNMLQWRTLDERDFIIDEIYNSLDHIYDMKQTGGPVFESNLRGMLKLLMGDDPESNFKPTILEFMGCYLHSDFRRWLKYRSRDPINLDFISELEHTGGDACLRNIAPYITSKFGRFTNDSTLMHIIGQEETPFSFDDIMNKGKIFLVKLGKGRFGSSVSNLLANMIVAKFKHAAMRRGDMNPDSRRNFYMYIDECQNLPSENFTELLAEARKYRMGLVLATQYTAQLSGESQRKSLLSAIIGNVGTLIMFRLGQEDARNMEPVLAPTFSFLDIVGLPNWHGYARLQIGGAAVAPFSFRSVKDESLYSESRASQIRSLSRSLYGGDRKFIGQRILERRNIWKEVKCADELNKIVSIED
jgi:DNA helicase HerA-like ATPase